MDPICLTATTREQRLHILCIDTVCDWRRAQPNNFGKFSCSFCLLWMIFEFLSRSFRNALPLVLLLLLMMLNFVHWHLGFSPFRQYLCSHINIIVMYQQQISFCLVSKVRKLRWLDCMTFSQNDYEYLDHSFIHSCVSCHVRNKQPKNRAIWTFSAVICKTRQTE